MTLAAPRYVAVWHEAAVRRGQNHVRFLGYSGREMLAVRLSHFDPQVTRRVVENSEVASAGPDRAEQR